jgi:hypothetical protein
MEGKLRQPNDASDRCNPREKLSSPDRPKARWESNN